MAKPINLRQVKKQKLRKQKQDTAAENRIAFGISKSARQFAEKESNFANKRLADHKLDKN